MTSMRFRRSAAFTWLLVTPVVSAASFSSDDIIAALKPTMPLSCYPSRGIRLAEKEARDRAAMADPRCHAGDTSHALADGN